MKALPIFFSPLLLPTGIVRCTPMKMMRAGARTVGNSGTITPAERRRQRTDSARRIISNGFVELMIFLFVPVQLSLSFSLLSVVA
jgi:hypothetical protein